MRLREPTDDERRELKRLTRQEIGRFNAQGPNGLYDQARSGRPSKVSPQVKETIVSLIQDDPQGEGQLATFWTVAMMGLALVGKLGLRLSPSTLRGVFQRLGLRFGRPRLAMPRKVDQTRHRSSG